MLSNEKSKYTDKEIIEKGSRALIKELGYSGFIRFIRQVEGHNGQDYLKGQEEIYRDMSLDDIYEEAQKHWESPEVSLHKKRSYSDEQSGSDTNPNTKGNDSDN